MPFTYEYPRPALTVDCVIFGLDGPRLKVLLIQRDQDPFAGCWALPGGFVNLDEPLDAAAYRELEEETGLSGMALEQLYTFGRPCRDPRGHTVSVAYVGLVRMDQYQPRAADDARSVAWFALRRLPALAFDHAEIVAVAHRRLCHKARCEPLGLELLPRCFALADLQRIYQAVLGRALDAQRFRQCMLRSGLLIDVGQGSSQATSRSRRWYRFDTVRYRKAQERGLCLGLLPSTTR